MADQHHSRPPQTAHRPAPQAARLETAPPSANLPAKVEPRESTLATLRGQLQAPSVLEQLRAMLPAHIKPERFISVALMAVQRNPRLLNADFDSFVQACFRAATDGLLVDGREAALVDFYDTKAQVAKVQYLRMVEGRLKLLRNSGELKQIDAECVYPDDAFDYYTDERGPHLLHRPSFESTKRDPKQHLVSVYCVAITLDGGVYVEVMDRSQVERARLAGRASDSLMWDKWYDEGARKTVVNRITKRLPRATDRLGYDDEDEDQERQHQSVREGVRRGLSVDAAVDTAAREERVREQIERREREYAQRAPVAPGDRKAPAKPPEPPNQVFKGTQQPSQLPAPAAAPASAAGPTPPPAGTQQAPAGPAPARQPGRFDKTWGLYTDLYGKPPSDGEAQAAYKATRLSRTKAFLNWPADRTLASWGDLSPDEQAEFELRLSDLLEMRAEAEAGREPGDEAHAPAGDAGTANDEGQQELLPTRRRGA